MPGPPVTYSPPTEYPYEDLPSVETPYYAYAFNELVAAMVDILGAGGRLPALEAGGVAAYTDEKAQDALAAAFAAGTHTGITVTYDDASNRFSFTVTASGGSTDPEIVRDTIAAALAAGAGMTVTVDDGADTITVAATPAHFIPPDHGFLTWAFDPVLAVGSTILPVAGVAHLVKVKLSAAATVSNICLRVSAAGAGLANCFGALYSADGTRRGVTADLATSWQVSGYKEHSLAAPYAAPAGTYYVLLLVGSATTLPTFTRSTTSQAVNDGLTVGSLRWSTIGTGLTAAPSTLTLSGQADPAAAYWLALK